MDVYSLVQPSSFGVSAFSRLTLLAGRDTPVVLAVQETLTPLETVPTVVFSLPTVAEPFDTLASRIDAEHAGSIVLATHALVPCAPLVSNVGGDFTLQDLKSLVASHAPTMVVNPAHYVTFFRLYTNIFGSPFVVTVRADSTGWTTGEGRGPTAVNSVKHHRLLPTKVSPVTVFDRKTLLAGETLLSRTVLTNAIRESFGGAGLQTLLALGRPPLECVC